MKLQRTYQDKLGQTFVVDVEIAENAAKLDREILRLANKARLGRKATASAFGGVVKVAIRPVTP